MSADIVASHFMNATSPVLIACSELNHFVVLNNPRILLTDVHKMCTVYKIWKQHIFSLSSELFQKQKQNLIKT